MGGVGLQQFFICCFIGLAVRFQRHMKQDTYVTDQKRAFRMLYILYAVLTLITVSFTLPMAISNKQPHDLKYSRSASSSAWSSIPKAIAAAFQFTKHTSISSIQHSCSSLLCSSISSILGESCPAKRAISPVESRGRPLGRRM